MDAKQPAQAKLPAEAKWIAGASIAVIIAALLVLGIAACDLWPALE
jgi:hypothetical protein